MSTISSEEEDDLLVEIGSETISPNINQVGTFQYTDGLRVPISKTKSIETKRKLSELPKEQKTQLQKTLRHIRRNEKNKDSAGDEVNNGNNTTYSHSINIDAATMDSAEDDDNHSNNSANSRDMNNDSDTTDSAKDDDNHSYNSANCRVINIDSDTTDSAEDDDNLSDNSAYSSDINIDSDTMGMKGVSEQEIVKKCCKTEAFVYTTKLDDMEILNDDIKEQCMNGVSEQIEVQSKPVFLNTQSPNSFHNDASFESLVSKIEYLNNNNKHSHADLVPQKAKLTESLNKRSRLLLQSCKPLSVDIEDFKLKKRRKYSHDSSDDCYIVSDLTTNNFTPCEQNIIKSFEIQTAEEKTTKRIENVCTVRNKLKNDDDLSLKRNRIMNAYQNTQKHNLKNAEEEILEKRIKKCKSNQDNSSESPVVLLFKNLYCSEKALITIDNNGSLKEYLKLSSAAEVVLENTNAETVLRVRNCCWHRRSMNVTKLQKSYKLNSSAPLLRSTHDCLPNACICCCSKFNEFNSANDIMPYCKAMRTLVRDEYTHTYRESDAKSKTYNSLIKKAIVYKSDKQNKNVLEKNTDSKLASKLTNTALYFAVSYELMLEVFYIANCEITSFVVLSYDRSDFVKKSQAILKDMKSQVMTHTICCWSQREIAVRTYSNYLSINAMRFIRKAHPCSKICTCCCRLKLLNLGHHSMVQLNSLSALPETSSQDGSSKTTPRLLSSIHSSFTETPLTPSVDPQIQKLKLEVAYGSYQIERAPIIETCTNQQTSCIPHPSGSQSSVDFETLVDSISMPKSKEHLYMSLHETLLVSYLMNDTISNEQKSNLAKIAPVLVERMKKIHLTSTCPGRVNAVLSDSIDNLTTLELKILADIILNVQSNMIQYFNLTSKLPLLDALRTMPEAKRNAFSNINYDDIMRFIKSQKDFNKLFHVHNDKSHRLNIIGSEKSHGHQQLEKSFIATNICTNNYNESINADKTITTQVKHNDSTKRLKPVSSVATTKQHSSESGKSTKKNYLSANETRKVSSFVNDCKNLMAAKSENYKFSVVSSYFYANKIPNTKNNPTPKDVTMSVKKFIEAKAIKVANQKIIEDAIERAYINTKTRENSKILPKPDIYIKTREKIKILPNFQLNIPDIDLPIASANTVKSRKVNLSNCDKNERLSENNTKLPIRPISNVKPTQNAQMFNKTKTGPGVRVQQIAVVNPLPGPTPKIVVLQQSSSSNTQFISHTPVYASIGTTPRILSLIPQMPVQKQTDSLLMSILLKPHVQPNITPHLYAQIDPSKQIVPVNEIKNEHETLHIVRKMDNVAAEINMIETGATRNKNIKDSTRMSSAAKKEFIAKANINMVRAGTASDENIEDKTVTSSVVKNEDIEMAEMNMIKSCDENMIAKTASPSLLHKGDIMSEANMIKTGTMSDENIKIKTEINWFEIEDDMEPLIYDLEYSDEEI